MTLTVFKSRPPLQSPVNTYLQCSSESVIDYFSDDNTRLTFKQIPLNEYDCMRDLASTSQGSMSQTLTVSLEALTTTLTIARL
mgnify:CR=1 FL=1|jgi:hypothetical protein